MLAAGLLFFHGGPLGLCDHIAQENRFRFETIRGARAVLLHAEGTLGFYHYPDPNESEEPGIVEYRRLMNVHFPGKELNRYSLYGYAFGMLVVEGPGRAGRNLTRDGFLDAMESIKDWDSGGILPPVSFSAENHHAQRAGVICELKDGKFVPLTDWLEP